MDPNPVTTTTTTTSSSSTAPQSGADGHGLVAAHELIKRLEERLTAAIKGRDDVVELVLVALLSDGHVLLEDYPGSGKTTLARALGEAIVEDPTGAEAAGGVTVAPFRRIQFTPDLLPSDITGTNVFDVESGRFSFRRGPLFAHVVLADEVNRTSPKVQAAMLEAMAEKQVTADETTHRLDDLFFVIATQNPLDLAGTYPLPTPQLDRFLFKIRMTHIDRASELAVLEQYPKGSLDLAAGHRGVTRSEVLAARRAVRHQVRLDPVVREALVDLARDLRADERVLQGASTRSLVLLLPALQARALVRGRDHVLPDDLDALAVPVFEHRLEVAPGMDEAESVVRQHAATQVERLARESLARR